MTDPVNVGGASAVNAPETPSEIAKQMWDTAIEHLEAATNDSNPLVSDAYVRIGELALKAAQFALANPALLLGIPEDGAAYGLPPGAPPLPSHITGAPPLPIWGAPKS